MLKIDFQSEDKRLCIGHIKIIEALCIECSHKVCFGIYSPVRSLQPEVSSGEENPCLMQGTFI